MKSYLMLGALCLASVSQATVLIFQDDAGALITQGDLDDVYGDNVTSTSQGGLAYGGAYGFTPNVTVNYTATAGSVVGPWATNYGDLVNVIWGAGPQTGENTGIVTLTADTDLVQLHELDVAGWPGSAPDAFLRVYDASNTLVFENLGPFSQTTHDNFVFTNIIDTQIRIEFSQGWWTALDNIAFSQTAVPEPATMAILGLGALALRRRNRKS